MVGLIGVSIDLVINLYYRAFTLSFEGASNATPTSLLWLKEPGVLMLLTAYKVISYRNGMNRTWAALSVCIYRYIDNLPFRITLIARDSMAYFVIVFGW